MGIALTCNKVFFVYFPTFYFYRLSYSCLPCWKYTGLQTRASLRHCDTRNYAAVVCSMHAPTTWHQSLFTRIYCI